MQCKDIVGIEILVFSNMYTLYEITERKLLGAVVKTSGTISEDLKLDGTSSAVTPYMHRRIPEIT